MNFLLGVKPFHEVWCQRRVSGRAESQRKGQYEKTVGYAGCNDTRPFLLTPEPRQSKR
jgi:hypothetical protein